MLLLIFKNIYFIFLFSFLIFLWIFFIIIFSCSGMFRNVPCSWCYRRPITFLWFIPWHLLYAIWILWDINYFGAKLQVFSCFLSREKRVFVERNAAPHSHNFPNLETHQNASETFFAEFSRSNQNTLTSSVGIWGNGILDQKRKHIAVSFTERNKLKVFTWKTITPPFSKLLLVARFTLLWRHDGQTHRTAALTSLWLLPGTT